MAIDGRYQIGEVSDAVGLSIRTIRYYEEMGVVIPSGRSAGGFRLYTDRDLDRLRRLKRLKPINFSLEEIQEVLELEERAQAGALDASDRIRLAHFATAAEASCRRLREHLEMAEEVAQALRTAERDRAGARRS